MGSAFSGSINLESLLYDAEAGINKLSEAARSVPEAVSPAIESIKKLSAAVNKIPVGKAYKEFGVLAAVGLGAFKGLTTAVKAFGAALRVALGPLRLVFFIMELIAKANVFSKIASLLNKLSENASGSTALGNTAKDLKVSEKQLRAFERANEIHQLGYDTNALATWRSNITNPHERSKFATLGFSDEEIDKMAQGDAISGFLKTQQALFKYVEANGGRDAIGSDAVMRDMTGAFGVSYDNYYSQRAGYGAFVKDYQNDMNKDVRDDKSRQSFEKAWTRLSQSFERFVDNILNPLFSVFEVFIVKMTAFLDWLNTFSFSKAFDSAKEVGADALNKIKGMFGLETDGKKGEASALQGQTKGLTASGNKNVLKDFTEEQAAAVRSKASEVNKRVLADESVSSRINKGKYKVDTTFEKQGNNTIIIKVKGTNTETNKTELLAAETIKVEGI